MKMELSKWRPGAEPMTPKAQEIGKLIRAALPLYAALGKVEWEYGSLRKMAQKEGPAGAVLDTLNWRLREKYEVEQRTVGEWHIVGAAIVNGMRVDFSGEYLRDYATGAFREFRLHTIG